MTHSMKSLPSCWVVLFAGFCLFSPATVMAGSWEIGDSFFAPSSQTNGLTFDGNYLWHTNDFQPILYKIDPFTGLVVSQEATKVPDQGDLEYSDGFLYICSENRHILYKVNMATGATVDTIQVHGIPIGRAGPNRRDSIQMEGVTFDGFNVWVDGGTNIIIRVDLSTKKSYRYIMPLEMGYLDGMTWAFDHLWVVTNNATIYELDPCTMGILDRFDAPANVGGGPEGFAFDGENLWFADNELDKIYKIILKDKLLTKRAATSGAARASGCDKGELMSAADDIMEGVTALLSDAESRRGGMGLRPKDADLGLWSALLRRNVKAGEAVSLREFADLATGRRLGTTRFSPAKSELESAPSSP